MKGLQAKRKEKGLTQKEVAEKFSIALQTYRNYEYGLREPKQQTLKKFAEFFNCTIDDLL